MYNIALNVQHMYNIIRPVALRTGVAGYSSTVTTDPALAVSILPPQLAYYLAMMP